MPGQNTARRIAALIDEIANASGAPKRFATARGSIYVQLPDGTTVRYKAPRREHGNDFGWMSRSELTTYLTPQDANRLSLVEAQGPGAPFRLIRDTESPRLAVMQDGDPRPIRGTIVPYESDPRVGLMPLETWPRNSRHFGNPITAVEPEPNWADWLERQARGEAPPDWSG